MLFSESYVGNGSFSYFIHILPFLPGKTLTPKPLIRANFVTAFSTNYLASFLNKRYLNPKDNPEVYIF